MHLFIFPECRHIFDFDDATLLVTQVYTKMLNTPIDVVLNLFWDRNHVSDKVTDLESLALLLLPAVL